MSLRSSDNLDRRIGAPTRMQRAVQDIAAAHNTVALAVQTLRSDFDKAETQINTNFAKVSIRMEGEGTLRMAADTALTQSLLALVRRVDVLEARERRTLAGRWRAVRAWVLVRVLRRPAPGFVADRGHVHIAPEK